MSIAGRLLALGLASAVAAPSSAQGPASQAAAPPAGGAAQAPAAAQDEGDEDAVDEIEVTDDRAPFLSPGEGDAIPGSASAPSAPDMAEGDQAPGDEAAEPLPAALPLEPEPPPPLEPSTPTVEAVAPAPAAPDVEEEVSCAEADDEEPCSVVEQARPLIYGGLATGALGLFGAIGFLVAGTAERLQAQSLLDTSEAFAKVDDRTVVRDPGHEDVARYEEHRATASVMTQLAWISVGIALAGATTAGTAFFLSLEAEECSASD